MKTTSKEEFIPRALQEVWEWKDSIQRDVQHLPPREALREIMRMAHAVAVEQGLATPAGKIAETPAKYAAKRKRT
jgi:hypothetical protein